MRFCRFPPPSAEFYSLKKLKRFKGGKNTCDVALGWIALKSRTEDALINEMNALVRLKIFRESNNMMTMMIEDAIDDSLEMDTVSPIELTPTISIIITIIINTNMIIVIIIIPTISIIITIIINANMIIIIITWSLP